MPLATYKVKQLVADISRHDSAAPMILADGKAVVPALAAYLAGPPQSVPHARRFAVAMLAAIPGIESETALRRLLHAHDTRSLSPAIAASERLVQNDAFRVLLEHAPRCIPDEIAHGLRIARLPAAAEAVGRLAMTQYVPELIDMLTDDYLSDSAREALALLGPAVRPELLGWLQTEPRGTSELRRRLIIIELLAQLRPSPTVRQALEIQLNRSEPAISGAAALALLTLQPDNEQIDLAFPIVRGALLPLRTLAERCLESVNQLPATALIPAMDAVCGLRYLPDLYGTPCLINDAQRAALAGHILCRPDVDASRIVTALPQHVLLRALRTITRVSNAETVATLKNHSDKNIREAFFRVTAEH